MFGEEGFKPTNHQSFLDTVSAGDLIQTGGLRGSRDSGTLGVRLRWDRRLL